MKFISWNVNGLRAAMQKGWREAFDRLETVEHTAKIVLNAQLLGGGVPLTEEEVARLQGLRGMYQTLREVRHG